MILMLINVSYLSISDIYCHQCIIRCWMPRLKIFVSVIIGTLLVDHQFSYFLKKSLTSTKLPRPLYHDFLFSIYIMVLIITFNALINFMRFKKVLQEVIMRLKTSVQNLTILNPSY